MEVTLKNTSKIVQLNGVPGRVWEGHTSSGIPVIAFITRIAVPNGQDQTQFEKELQETAAPSAEAAAYPLRMIL